MINKTKDKLKQILFDAFRDSWELGGGFAFRYKHGTEVANLAVKIATIEKLSVDCAVLYIAGLFHDIGKVKAMNAKGEIDYSSEANKNHEQIDFDDLKKYIGDIVDDQTIKKTAKIISEELKDDSSLERKILKDADELGNFGYSQVWRTFNYAALSGQTYEQMLKFWEDYGLAERKKWIDQLYFPSSKKAALKRFERFAEFLKIIKTESVGDDLEN